MVHRKQYRAIVPEWREGGRRGVVVSVSPGLVQAHVFQGAPAPDDGAQQRADLGELPGRSLHARYQGGNITLEVATALLPFAVAIGVIGVVQVEKGVVRPQQPEFAGLVLQGGVNKPVLRT